MVFISGRFVGMVRSVTDGQQLARVELTNGARHLWDPGWGPFGVWVVCPD